MWIKAPGQVDPRALHAAADRAERMLTLVRQGIPDCLADAGAEIAIFPRGSYVTELPEFAALKGRHVDSGFPYDEFLGLGAIPGQPVSAVSEENLLALLNDPNTGSGVTIHEFAHTKHNLCDRTVAPAVARAVRNVYATLAIGVAVSLVPVALFRIDAVRLVFGYEQPTDYVQAALTMPVGTPADFAEQLADAAHAVNEQLPGKPIRTVRVFVGQPSQLPQTGPLSTQSHLAGVGLDLSDESLREATA